MENDDLAFIDSVAASKMGVPPSSQAAPVTAPPPANAPISGAPTAQQPPVAPVENKATDMDKATKQMAPKDEGTKSDPFEFFEVDMGDGRKEVLTPNQIRGMVPRYKEMNYTHQQKVAPVKSSLDFINEIREKALAEGETIDDNELANFLRAAVSAYAHSPDMGAAANGQGPATNTKRENISVNTNQGSAAGMDVETQLSQWEQENAVSLPPMYKDAISKTGKMESELAEMKQLLTQLAQGSKGALEGASTQLDAAKAKNSQAGIQMIQNNMQKVQMKYGFPDDAEQQFMTFIQERGYMIEDLMDATMADRLGADFKAVQDSPELDRLKAISQRRQAYTGTMSPGTSVTTGAAPTQAAPDADMEFINTVADAHMKKKNM